MAATQPSPSGPRTGPGYDKPTVRQWITLGIVLMSTVIVVLDTTILNVAIPTILHEFGTTLPSLEWVITGYSLTFATFLIIGGRLGDIYGQRRVFVTGAALFACGSLLASLSWNVASLVVGEAIIEGLGASLMLPATLALLSNTFQGRGRAMAFAAWGAVAGSAAGLGPVIGGLLTTDFSWRWSFRINVIIAPLAILGAMLFIPATKRSGRREPLDGPGAALIAIGMFLLVFALSEGGSYGWITPIASVDAAGHQLWSAHAPISIIPVILAASAGVLYAFYRHERARERRHASPLFEFGLLRYRTFRYGLLTTTVLSMGQLGPELRPGPVPAGGQAPDRPAERPVGPALRPVHHRRRPHRRTPHQPHRHRPGDPPRAGHADPEPDLHGGGRRPRPHLRPSPARPDRLRAGRAASR